MRKVVSRCVLDFFELVENAARERVSFRTIEICMNNMTTELRISDLSWRVN